VDHNRKNNRAGCFPAFFLKDATWSTGAYTGFLRTNLRGTPEGGEEDREPQTAEGVGGKHRGRTVPRRHRHLGSCRPGPMHRGGPPAFSRKSSSPRRIAARRGGSAFRIFANEGGVLPSGGQGGGFGGRRVLFVFLKPWTPVCAGTAQLMPGNRSIPRTTALRRSLNGTAFFLGSGKDPQFREKGVSSRVLRFLVGRQSKGGTAKGQLAARARGGGPLASIRPARGRSC